MHIIQKQILDLIKKGSIAEMTLRDIGEAIGEDRSKPQKIKHHLQQLVKKGLVENRGSDYLAVKKNTKSNQSSLISLPILGAANCGEAISFADDHVESYLKISPALIKNRKNVFVVRAKGDSMNRAKIDGLSINDGDYALIDSDKKNPEDNDYILSIIDGLANIKKFKIDKDRGLVVLLSESQSHYDPIYIHKDDLDAYSVAGKVIGVLKSSY